MDGPAATVRVRINPTGRRLATSGCIEVGGRTRTESGNACRDYHTLSVWLRPTGRHFSGSSFSYDFSGLYWGTATASIWSTIVVQGVRQHAGDACR